MNLKQLVALYKDLAARKTPILDLSGPGLGKSSVKRQLALMLTTPTHTCGYYPIVMTNHDPVEVGGYLVPQRLPTGDLISQFTRPFFWDAIAGADGITKSLILHVDEITDAKDDGQKIAARMVFDRMVGTHRLPDGVWVLLSGNRRKDRSGVQRMASMFQNRLMQIDLEYDMDCHLEYLLPRGFPPAALAFIKTNPGLIYNDTVPTEPGPFCSPRSFEEGILDLVQIAQSRGLKPGELLPSGLASAADSRQKAALQNEHYILAYAALAGRVGAGVSAQFFTHLKYADKLPTMDEIAANPDKAKLPEEMGGEYQVSFMVAQTAREAQLPAVMQYFKRMKVEMQVVTMKGLIDRNHKSNGKDLPTLLATPGVATWCAKHGDVLVASA